MAVIEYDEYKQKLQALEPTLGELEKALGIPKAREELAELQKETEQDVYKRQSPSSSGMIIPRRHRRTCTKRNTTRYCRT